MEYLVAAFIIACAAVGAMRVTVFVGVKLVEVIANPIIAMHERREWHRIVMRNIRRKRKAIWKRETIGVALEFHGNEKRSGKGAYALESKTCFGERELCNNVRNL